MSVAEAADQAFVERVRTIATEVAALHADSVDREARFPAETIDALREAQALSAFVPEELGGQGVSFEALADACFELARRCAATSMVYGMHQIQVDSIVRHRGDSAWFEDYLRRLAAEERLIASTGKRALRSTSSACGPAISSAIRRMSARNAVSASVAIMVMRRLRP